MTDQAQDRTEQATPKRLREAAEKGQVARSRELTTLTMLLAGTGAMVMLGENLVRDIAGIARSGLQIERARVFDPYAMVNALQDAAFGALAAATPIVGVLIVAAIAGSVVPGGLGFSFKAVAFKWSKLDPIRGLGRVFSWRGLMELAKALAKFLVVGVGAYFILDAMAESIFGLGMEPIENALQHFGSMVSWGFLLLSVPLVLVVIVDVPFQIWDHARQLKMTRQEVKDEQKETDGNPEVKGRVRDLQRQMARARMMAKVPQADVIVTNPSHFAVALKYRPDEMSAPVMVAKGADLMAMQIRQIGVGADVAIVSSPLLARGLYYTAELDRDIPVALYRAVAEVLAHVFQLRESGVPFGPEPIDMRDVPIPEEVRQQVRN